METTIDIPESILQKIKRHALVDRKAIIARDLIRQVSERELVEDILNKSKLTEKDAAEMSAKIRKGLHQKYHGA